MPETEQRGTVTSLRTLICLDSFRLAEDVLPTYLWLPTPMLSLLEKNVVHKMRVQ